MASFNLYHNTPSIESTSIRGVPIYVPNGLLSNRSGVVYSNGRFIVAELASTTAPVQFTNPVSLSGSSRIGNGGSSVSNMTAERFALTTVTPPGSTAIVERPLPFVPTISLGQAQDAPSGIILAVGPSASSIHAFNFGPGDLVSANVVYLAVA